MRVFGVKSGRGFTSGLFEGFAQAPSFTFSSFEFADVMAIFERAGKTIPIVGKSDQGNHR
jgi:hypothetical protein